MLKKTIVLALAALAVSASAPAETRGVSIVGSSTVYPFATVVAERFGKNTKFKTPKVESTGSGGGLKLFCSGIGLNHPDITNASRRIKKSEQQKCADNNVKEIVEVKIGYDGIVLANAKSAERMNLSRKDIFLALAKQIPGQDGKLIDNPHETWHDVNKALPKVKIEVLGPPPTSGTRDAFAELAMEGGAKMFDDLKALRKTDKKAFKAVAHAVREDGAYIEAGENDNLIIQKLEANPDAVGIFGFSFLDQNADKVQGSMIDGQEPTFENIAAGDYPVSRSLYFYVKKAHVATLPAIQGYLAEFTADKAWGDEGYLTDKGLIPMPEAERNQYASDAKNLKPMEAL